MRKLYLLSSIFIMSCSTTKLFVSNEPGFDFYNGQFSKSIQQKSIGKTPALLLNDSLIVDVKSIISNLNRLTFDTISSLSIITSNKGQELFNEPGKNGIIFIVTKNFLNSISQNPDTIPFKKVKVGDNPLLFLDNITIDKSILQRINAQDIAAIEILKKETSRIYFKDKCNDGVVFITTKKYAIESINARFSHLNGDYKQLRAGKSNNFKKLIFFDNDSLVNKDKGYIGKIYNYTNVKSLNILPSSLAKEKYKGFDFNKKIVIEIIK